MPARFDYSIPSSSGTLSTHRRRIAFNSKSDRMAVKRPSQVQRNLRPFPTFSHQVHFVVAGGAKGSLMPPIVQQRSTQFLLQILDLLPVMAGSVVVIGGVLSLTGWIAHIPGLIDWDGNGITIKFNASVCATLLGTALVLNGFLSRPANAVRILSAAAAAIAAATLFQHITGVNLGIDTLVFNEPPGMTATAAPGRMGPPASFSMTIIGLSLILSTFRSGRRWAAMLGLGAVFVAGLSLSGYLLGANQLFALPRVTGIALQTAWMILFLGVGVVSSVREHGIVSTMLREDAGGLTFRRLVIPLVLISLVLGSTRVFLQEAGYVDTAFGTAARSVAEIALILALLWWTAENLSRSEGRAQGAAEIRAENETHRRIAIAQEAERRRIARDLHDHIGQQFTGLRLRLDALCKTIPTEADYAHEISTICDQTKKLDSDLSMLVWQMRPGVLDSHGLASALKSFVREWSANHSIEVEFQTTTSESRLPPETETNLYRIIQEALNNILKHAQAKKVSVTMNYLADEAIVVIEDDGRGFDTESDDIHTTESTGFGLVGMKERAVLVGGKLEIESTLGGGTAVIVRVPRKVRA